MEITTILLQKQHLYLPIAPAFLPKVKAKKYIQLGLDIRQVYRDFFKFLKSKEVKLSQQTSFLEFCSVHEKTDTG